LTRRIKGQEEEEEEEDDSLEPYCYSPKEACPEKLESMFY